MTRILPWFKPLGLLLLAAIGLLGCPKQPLLLIEPHAVTFGSTSTQENIRISNAGTGVLSWEVKDLPVWLTAEQVSGGKDTLPKDTTTTEIDILRLTLDRNAIPANTAKGFVVITSDGGEQEIPISVTQNQEAQLKISQSDIDFGENLQNSVILVQNLGKETLEWSATVSDDAPWLTLSPSSGSITATDIPAQITLAVDRSSLTSNPTPYTGVVTFTSNGGNATLSASMSIPLYTINPQALDFGEIMASKQQSLSITNHAFDPLTLTVTPSTDDGANWLTPANTNLTIPTGPDYSLLITADPTGLTPGSYTGSLLLSDTASGTQRTVTVTMSVAAFHITPTLLAFGEITEEQSKTVTLSNESPTPITWSLSIPGAASTWLRAEPTSGTLSTTTDVSITVDPLAVDPESYEATLTFTYPDGEKEILVTMSRPRPATLSVIPTSLDFGANRNEDILAILNAGIGVINWQIDTTAFPAWLSLTPTDANGITSGTVSGQLTDAPTLRIDRSQAPDGVFELAHTFNVVGSGDVDTTIGVAVSATIPRLPEIQLDAEEVDENSIDTLEIEVGETTSFFFIENTGDANLDWRIDPESQPSWVASIIPSQGLVEPGKRIKVTVTGDRDGLTYLGAQADLKILSNDPANPSLDLIVSILVPRQIIIRSRQNSLSFGLSDVNKILEVANFGDPDTVLDFLVTSSKSWLAVFPETGQSIGTSGNIKDWQSISVTVDRSQLDGTGSSAKLTIFAYTVENGELIPRDDVEKVEVSITVEAPALTIEAAKPRLRIPSLVRYVLMMRNIRYQALPIPESRLDEVGNLFRIFEKDTALELTESSQFLTTGSRLRSNILILLDYSGSMQEAARKVSDPLIAQASDPIQALYERAIPDMIQGMLTGDETSKYRVALGIFNERRDNNQSKIRLLSGLANEPEATRDEAFINRPDLLIERLRNTAVLDNGATQLYPVLSEAAIVLRDEDRKNNRLSFDDADVRAIVCITDGRITTPPGVITEPIDVLVATKSRLFVIGWGEKISSDPLIRLADSSGGHYYATKTEPTGEFDAFGLPLRLPLVSEIEDWCYTDPEDPCDQSIPNDLRSQSIFSYVTLIEENNIATEGRITFNDPNDQDSDCVQEQGDITGSFAHSQLDYLSVVGDPRMGQISLETEGLATPSVVTVRADYIPRNISQLQFLVTLTDLQGNAPVDTLSLNAALVPSTRGGIISLWSLDQNGDTITLNTDSEVLRYGEFGDLITLTITGATQPFLVNFEVLTPEFSGNEPDTKFFVYPDSIEVAPTRFLATSFPSPYIGAIPAPVSTDPYTLDLGTDINEAQLALYNLGGSHVRLGETPSPLIDAGLEWLFEFGAGDAVLTLTPISGFVTSTLTPDILTLIPDRTLQPGTYEGEIIFTYGGGSLNIGGTLEPVYVQYEILPPELSLSAQNFTFDDPAVTDQTLQITNIGQSILRWTIDTATLPNWLELTLAAGELGADSSELLNIRVDATGLPAGTYEHTFVISTNTESDLPVTVTFIVP